MSEANNKISLQKLIVGHFIEKIPEDCKKNICYVLQGDGVWEVRKNKLGTFTSHIKSVEIPGLVCDMEEGWELNVPSIPSNILVQIVSFFRKINGTFDSEVFVQVFYDFSKGEYFAHVPKQVVSGASVDYSNEFQSDSNKLLVFEIHSHNTMDAFFSGIDDADEKSDRFYGVIGRINQYYPHMLVRLSVGGRRQEVNVEDLFDISADETYLEVFPSSWISNVTKRTPKQRKIGRKVYIPRKGEDNQIILFDKDDDNISNQQDSFYDWQSEIFGDKPIRGEDWEDLLGDVEGDFEVPNWRKGKF